MPNAAEKKPAVETKRREKLPLGKSKEALDRKLDEALEESFPGSDPVSMSQPAPSPADKEET
ncbi:MAG: hypothetical protein HXX10_03220 [Rhodoplanes sp.]|uniref:hypothetical protein n=1 Tax=Rhodoplanes sp. TaxID=1968906 RepID=UPI0017AAE645|nr:hypothetical protein [Rhodoplanes sp.]NVO13026.1 hypothetical protein [Rhodoplanes sp.]